MSSLDDDPIWPHFRPLWCDLYHVAREQLTIAGGYGLYLKQNWLIENPGVLPVIPMTQWPNDRIGTDLSTGEPRLSR